MNKAKRLLLSLAACALLSEEGLWESARDALGGGFAAPAAVGGGFLLKAEASWTLKRIANQDWRNGSRLLSQEFGRDHGQVKAVMSTMPEHVQSEYKDVCAAYASLSGLRGQPGIDDQLAQLKAKAAQIYALFFGHDPSSARFPENPVTSTAVLDSMQAQLQQLQQRQQEQQRELLQRLQQEQQEERVRMAEEIAAARERQQLLQRESQAANAHLSSAKALLLQAQQRVSALRSAGGAIESLTGRTRSAVNAFEQLGDTPPTSRAEQEIKSLEQEASGIKASLGQELHAVNGLMMQIVELLNAAEQRATALSNAGPDARAAAEPVLGMVANLKVILTNLERYMKDEIGQLESKQLTCDSAVAELQQTLFKIHTRNAQNLGERAAAVVKFAAEEAPELENAIRGGANGLLKQIAAQQTRTTDALVDWSVLGAAVHQLGTLVASWSQNIARARATLDVQTDAANEISRERDALPPAHQSLVNLENLHAAVTQLNSIKSSIRQHQAQVTNQLQVLAATQKRGMDWAIQQQQQQQQHYYGMDGGYGDGY